MEADIQRFGAKGARLKYVEEEAGKRGLDIPIEPFVLSGVGEDWRKKQAEIDALEWSVVRSSSPYEDRGYLEGHGRVSLAGLLKSIKCIHGRRAQEVLDSVHGEYVRRYAWIHGLPQPLPIGLIFHKHVKGVWNWSMLRHPHKKHIYFFGGRPTKDVEGTINLVFDQERDLFYTVSTHCAMTENPGSDLTPHQMTANEVGLDDAMFAFEHIELFPKLQSPDEAQMEFCTQPFSFFQWRPFRRQEEPAWEYDSGFMTKLAETHELIHCGIAFGMTPPEGLELRIVHARSNIKVSKMAREFELASSMSYRDRVSHVAQMFALSEEEQRVMLAQKEAILEHSIGSYFPLLFDGALIQAHVHADLENTCLVVESMKDYNDPVDILFPGARACILGSGTEFLAHDNFRMMQSYDVVLTSYNILTEKLSGDVVRLFSNGVYGVIAVPRSA